MLLQKIELKGFLSYYGQENEIGVIEPIVIDFRQSPLWLIHGKNGTGKTSLFDAISFALYNKHRGSSTNTNKKNNINKTRSYNAHYLIHHDADKAEINLEFKLENKSYCIQRTITRTNNRGKLGAKVWSIIRYWTGNHWQAIANYENAVSMWVEQHFKMTYETFVSSVLLRQGEADAFLKTKPTKRRERLLEVLDLEFYKKLGDRATQKSNEYKKEQSRIQQELEQLNEVTKKDIDIEAQEKVVGDLEENYRQLNIKKTHKEQEKKNASDASNYQQQITDKQKHQQEYQALIYRQKPILEDVQKYRDLNDVIKQLDSLWKSRNYLKKETDLIKKTKEKLEGLQTELIQLNSKLEQTKEQKQQKIKDLKQIVLQLPELQQAEAVINNDPNQIESEEDEKRYLRTIKTLITQGINYIQQNLNDLKSDRLILQKNLEHRENVSHAKECPICGSQLNNPEVKKRLEEEYDSWKNQIASLQQAEEKLNNKYSSLRKSITKIENNLEQINDEYRASENQIVIAYNNQENANNNLNDLLKRKQEIEQEVEECRNVLPTKWKVHPAYEDREALEQLRRKLNNLSNAEAEAEQLAKAKEYFNQIDGEIKTFQELLEKIPAEHRRLVKDVNNELKELEQQIKQIEESKKAENRKLTQMQDLNEQYDKKREQLDDISKEFNYYERLAYIFGAKGLQAKIIQEAQEKIKLNANNTLARLSDGRWQVDLEENDAQTELNIVARDLNQPGTPVQQFEYLSSGEKFIVAVSLAVAIGQSIYGGRTVDSLVIDEGFGSLDDEKRPLMVKELKRLSEDILQGGRVIVVSHQNDVCEGFDSRYHVFRDDNHYAQVEQYLSVPL